MSKATDGCWTQCSRYGVQGARWTIGFESRARWGCISAQQCSSTQLLDVVLARLMRLEATLQDALLVFSRRQSISMGRQED